MTTALDHQMGQRFCTIAAEAASEGTPTMLMLRGRPDVSVIKVDAVLAHDAGAWEVRITCADASRIFVSCGEVTGVHLLAPPPVSPS